MKDYCSTEYERKSFITKYDIDKEKSEITIYYADDETLKVPYSFKEEIRLLNNMKKQVKYYDHFIDRAKKEKRVLRFKRLLALIMAGYGTVLLSYLSIGAFLLGSAGIFIMPTIFMNLLIIMIIKRKFDEISDKIDNINEGVNDYNKNMFYLNNEKVFANERLMRKDVINNTPKKVKYLIGNSKDIPLINLNNLENISMKDLKKTYEASLQSRGPELVLKKNTKS